MALPVSHIIGAPRPCIRQAQPPSRPRTVSSPSKGIWKRLSMFFLLWKLGLLTPLPWPFL